MAVRFYVDADILGLAKVMALLRWDLTYPGDPGGTVKRHARPACPIATTDVDDDQWIPVVAPKDGRSSSGIRATTMSRVVL